MSKKNKKLTPDYATGKLINLSNPEELVRQEYERVLLDSYGYPKESIDIEVRIPRGRGFFPDVADIVVYNSNSLSRDPTKDIIGIIETKKPGRKDGLAQLKSYMTATSAQWGVWTNSNDIAYLCRNPKIPTAILDDYLNNIPFHGQGTEDVGRLNRSDLRPFERHELRSAFRRILNKLYANTSISRREKLGNEMIKVIFAKLVDEKTYANRPPSFRAEAGENPEDVKKRLDSLFEQARDELKGDGVFDSHERIILDAESVAWVVGQLERGSLLETNTDIVGDAFEIFAESHLVGEKGQFFTPRSVVQIAVKITNPQSHHLVCDPACGSGGFLISAMKHMWDGMNKNPKWKQSPRLKDKQKELAANNLFGIDKENDLVKIAKAHMAIAGDGRSSIVHENSLHRVEDFADVPKSLFNRRGKIRKFDIILTNPPYGTKTKISTADSSNFELGHRWNKKGVWKNSGKPVERNPYVLFVERCIDMAKEGGKIAIVLPETVFHGTSLGYIRQFIIEHSNIIAIISLPHNTFRPLCNAKTCLLILEKTNKPQEDVIFASPDEMGHDHLGRPMYRPNSGELWDDLAIVLDELDHPNDQSNKFVFSVPWSDIDKEVLVPLYYTEPPQKTPKRCKDVRLGDIVDEGIIMAWDGHGSPESQYKGKGDTPYIRVSDIVNWELYRNPVSRVPEHEYKKVLGVKHLLEEKDVILVRRGSYRIGTVAMASYRDKNVLLTRELLTLRITNLNNEYGLNPFYLLFLLSTPFVQNQIRYKVLIDTTLPNLDDRWRTLILPIHNDKSEIKRLSKMTEEIIRSKWLAQDKTEILRQEMGGLTT